MSSFVSRLISQLVGRWDRTLQSRKAAAVSAPVSSLLPRRAAMALLSASLLGVAVPAASAKGTMPEDILKGGLFISDSSFPTKWTSPQAFAAQVKKQPFLFLLLERCPCSSIFLCPLTPGSEANRVQLRYYRD